MFRERRELCPVAFKVFQRVIASHVVPLEKRVEVFPALQTEHRHHLALSNKVRFVCLDRRKLQKPPLKRFIRTIPNRGGDIIRECQYCLFHSYTSVFRIHRPQARGNAEGEELRGTSLLWEANRHRGIRHDMTQLQSFFQYKSGYPAWFKDESLQPFAIPAFLFG